MDDESKPSCWSKRTKLEKYLLPTMVLLILTVIGLLAGLIVVILKKDNSTRSSKSSGKNETTKTEKVCSTPGCVAAASSLLKTMDMSVDPCKDFYQFSCGNFLKTTKIGEDQNFAAVLLSAQNLIYENMQSAIESPIQKNEPKTFQLIRSLYKGCMDTELIEKENLVTMQNILKESGGWPVLEGDNWNEADFEWTKTVTKLKDAGCFYGFFIFIKISPDPWHTIKHIIELSPPTTRPHMLFKDLKNTTNPEYKLMVDVAEALGADKVQAEKEMVDTFNFFSSLQVLISNPGSMSHNITSTDVPMTVSKLQQNYPSIGWLEYLNNIVSPYAKITKDDVVLVKYPEYITKLETLIKRTSKRVQANYALWMAIKDAIPHLTERVRKAYLNYNKGMQKVSRPRNSFCTETVTRQLTSLSNAMYMKQYFNKDIEQNVSNILTDLRTVYSDIIKNSDWLDEKTRKNALDKMESMPFIIGYPKEYLREEFLDNHYKNLNVDQKHYLRSILNIKIHQNHWSFKCLSKPTSSFDCFEYPGVLANAEYVPEKNQIHILLGFLTKLTFDIDRPSYLNYGSICFIIGHEISHGFDDRGKQYDKNGNLVNWWTPKTNQVFSEKAQCYINQYGNLIEPETNIKLNGLQSLGENIADNGGAKVMYLAYMKWLERNGNEATLPGLPYNPNQLFWIAGAEQFCAMMKKEFMIYQLKMAPHLPNSFRINIPFSNTEYFAKEFNCSVGTPMNPKKKCKLW